LIIDLVKVYAGADEDHFEALGVDWKEEREAGRYMWSGKAETRLDFRHVASRRTPPIP
jgi:hypothetical protein